MHNIMRFIRQNKKQIIKVALIVAFLFGCLQLLNYLSGKEKDDSSNYYESSIYNETNGTVLSDKSAVSGASVSKSEIKKFNNKIEEFIKYCNESNVEKAYNMISNDCKAELYPNMDDFISNYYNALFENQNRNFTIENWIEDTYIVRFTGDLLATGKIANDSTYQDYITMIEEDGTIRLNINKYIGQEEINKKSDKENIEISVLNRKKYMDYEIYTIQVVNHTGDLILLDPIIETDGIYLKDSNDTKHNAVSNEIIKDDLQVYEGQTKTIQIKFKNPYIVGRKIKSLCFSEVVLNYDMNNYGAYKTTKLSINL